MPKTAAERQHLILVLGLCAALRFAACLVVPTPMASDWLGYWEIASAFSEGRGLTIATGQPTAWVSLGYPIFLGRVFALTGPSVIVAKALNILLGTGAVLFCYIFSRRLFMSHICALVSAILFAVYAEAIIQTTYIGKESLLVCLIMVLFAVAATPAGAQLDEDRRAVFFGALLGALALVANVAFSLVPAMLFVLALRRPAIRPLARFCGLAGMTALITTAPVCIRNSIQFGHYGLNNNAGFNLYIGNNPNASAYFTSVADTPLGPRWPQLMAQHGEYGASEIAGNEAKAYIKADLPHFLAQAAKKALAFWEPPLPSSSARTPVAEAVMRWVWLLQYVGMLSFFFVALLAARAQRSGMVALLLALAGLTAAHMLYYVMARYRFPIMPIVAVGAGCAAPWLLARWRRFAAPPPTPPAPRSP